MKSREESIFKLNYLVGVISLGILINLIYGEIDLITVTSISKEPSIKIDIEG